MHALPGQVTGQAIKHSTACEPVPAGHLTAKQATQLSTSNGGESWKAGANLYVMRQTATESFSFFRWLPRLPR